MDRPSFYPFLTSFDKFISFVSLLMGMSRFTTPLQWSDIASRGLLMTYRNSMTLYKPDSLIMVISWSPTRVSIWLTPFSSVSKRSATSLPTNQGSAPFGCSSYSLFHFRLFTPMQALAGCLQSGRGQVKQLELYGQTPDAESLAGLRPGVLLCVLCGLCRVLAAVLLWEVSG